MRHNEIILPSAAILRIDFTVRNWARSCYVIGIKKIPDLASTRFRIHSGLQNIHSGERIQKVPDSPANSPDTCGRKEKSCEFKKYPDKYGCGRGIGSFMGWLTVRRTSLVFKTFKLPAIKCSLSAETFGSCFALTGRFHQENVAYI